MKYLTQQTIILAAYTARPLAITGSVISVESASASFLMSINGGEEFPMKAGWTLDQSPDTFRFVMVRNPNAQAITISLYIGSQLMSYASRQTVTSDAPTYPKGSGLVNLGAGATNTYSGLDSSLGPTCARKEFIVFNNDSNLDLYLMAGANVMSIVPPRQAWGVLCSGAISVYNPNGAPVQYVVGETFYS